jgi:hypothetical protein
VIRDPDARYFGAKLGARTLLPGDDAIVAETRFEDWIDRAAIRTPAS